MQYHVISVNGKQLHVLQPDEVNDMDFDSTGRIVVFGHDGLAYYLLADSAVLSD